MIISNLRKAKNKEKYFTATNFFFVFIVNKNNYLKFNNN